MKTRLLIAAFAAVLAPGAMAQTTAYTDPVGFITIPIEGNGGSGVSNTFVGLSMVTAPEFQGPVSADAPSTISVSGTPWVADQFNTDATYPSHYVEFISGAAKGMESDIVDTTTNSLTLADDLSSLVNAADQFIVRSHWTLGKVFGTGAEVFLDGGSGTADSDNVVVWNPMTQTPITYYNKTSGFGGTGWRSAASASIDQQNVPIYPDQGFYIANKQNVAHELVLAAHVKLVSRVSAVESGYNFATNPFPVGTVSDGGTTYNGLTLGTSGLYQPDNSRLAGGAGSAAADTITIFKPGGVQETFYFKTSGFGGTGWRSTSSASVDRSGEEIPVGSSVIINLKSGNPPFSWSAAHELPLLNQ